MTEAATGTSTILRILGVVAVLAVGGVALYAVDWGFLTSEFTAYEFRCGLPWAGLGHGPRPVVDFKQCSQLDTTGHIATTFKIFKDQRRVAYGDGKGIEGVKCDVTSRTNWKCTFDFDKTLSFGAKNGVFWETVTEGYRAQGFFVPRWKFLLVEMGL
jgi:hypothetical protein